MAKAHFPHIVATKDIPIFVSSLGFGVAALAFSGLWAADISTSIGLQRGTTIFLEDNEYYLILIFCVNF